MTDNNRHVRLVKVSDFKAKKDLEGAIDLQMDDGTVYRIPPPELWPDKITQLNQDNDTLGAARALIGEDRYEEFVAKGGSAMLVLGVIGDEHGITVPESDASSSS